MPRALSDSSPEDTAARAERDRERARVQRAFGVVLRRLRDEQGMSQEDLAAESGVGRSFIAKLETARTQPTLTTVFLIAGALRVAPEAIVGAVSREATS